ncbi:hypothetical protein IMZ48_24850 [Candidatus Bathyarchaeota archaeon]|nr:hypothetical protein [Candidatus Bathyarchaeota archaeon]
MALEARQDEPAAPELAAPENPDEAEGPGDAPPASLCSRFNLKKLREDPGERKRLWDASGAGVLADEYINEHGWEFWVMDLDEKIFGDKGSASDHWDCRDKGGLCNIEKECREFPPF